MEYVNLLTKVIEYVLLAWFISKLEPFQVFIEDYLSERIQLMYTLLSCVYCLTFWITFSCLSFGIDIPNQLSVACLAALLIKSIVQVWENKRKTKN